MSSSLDFWKLLAGLGIFLFGMLLIEESVKALSGRTFRRIIRTYTNGRLRAIERAVGHLPLAEAIAIAIGVNAAAIVDLSDIAAENTGIRLFDESGTGEGG